MDEAHVEHGVGFIQDQKFNPLQRQQSLVAQIKQAARGGHQDVGTFANLSHLLVLADTAKNQSGPNLDVLRVGLDVVVDLGCELAGRGKHQHTRNRASVHQVVRQMMNNRQRECRRFARARLGNSHHVTPLEDVRNGLGLNGGGALVSERHQGVEHPGVQAHVRKLHELF